eukprot:TRINITY_DN30314_c0_g1_i1.p1 TRINITY_DN30314_c0_g1~~TRINITY_DN30314_c0_g1_i1.p1  ORF type:complete len:1248 (+),score=194.36 TRINITY_DN30314_c0_g1_i1:118-3861(+)
MAPPAVGQVSEKAEQRGIAAARSASSGDRGTKQRKGRKTARTDKRDRPLIETRQFADNEYTGPVKHTAHGARILESNAAKYVWRNGLRYEGPFVASQIDGMGTFTWPDGSVYEGALQNGRRNGQGRHTLPDGLTRYEGQWLDGKRHGTGQLTYTANGESQYYGDWRNDMKHGHGRQIWPSGNVYEGQWRFGAMSGEGFMTWNDGGFLESYRGHWEKNRPQGEGTYTWHASEPRPEPGGKEMPSQQMNNRYEGSWDNGVRHGSGTFHYANGANYRGEWDLNSKSGTGSYTFEDGRVYRGPFTLDQMTGDVEGCGQGGGTANGRSAVGSRPPPPANIGAQDNPVRRCIDISDLDLFCLPQDVESLVADRAWNETSPPSLGSDPLGHREDVDKTSVMRQVHNMLLRHLGDLKQLYARYRVLSPTLAPDPFVLSQCQLWLLARDSDLLTPTCSIARLDRMCFSGPRRHQEVAHLDLQEIRPLTPRSNDESVPSLHGSPAPTSDSVCKDSIAVDDPIRNSAQGERISAWTDIGTTDVSSVPSSGFVSPSHVEGSHGPPSPSDMAWGGSEHADRASDADPGEDNQDEASSIAHKSRTSHDEPQTQSRIAASLTSPTAAGFVEEEIPLPAFTFFWRREGATNIYDIHLPGTILIFRQFLEGLVRLALARYPNERGLERQMCRLFKERLVPCFGRSPSSESMWASLANTRLQEVSLEFEAIMWQLFKNLAVGDGAYRPPAGAPEASDSTLSEEVATSNGVVKKIGSADEPHVEADVRAAIHAVADLEHGSQFVVLESSASPASPPSAPQMAPQAAASIVVALRKRTRRRGLGGQQRRVHVRARLDVTIRVKDLLQLLRGVGLLIPAHGPDHIAAGPAVAAVGIFGAVLPPPAVGSTSPLTGDDTMTPIAELSELRGMLFKPSSAASDRVVDGSSLKPTRVAENSANRHKAAASDGPRDARKSIAQRALELSQSHDDRQPKHEDSLLGVMGAEEAVAPPPQCPRTAENAKPEEVLVCDFRLTFIDVLQIVLEVISPSTTQRLRWSLHGAESPVEELVPLLEFVETELTFVEFKRSLLRLVERQTQLADTEICRRLPLHRRFEGFLRHVLMPSLEEPYHFSNQHSSTEETSQGVLATEGEHSNKLMAADAVSADMPLPEPSSPIANAKPNKGKGQASKKEDKAEEEARRREAEEAERVAAEIEAERLRLEELAQREPVFWLGFDGGTTLLDDGLEDAEELAAHRVWLDCYHQEVMDW